MFDGTPCRISLNLFGFSGDQSAASHIVDIIGKIQEKKVEYFYFEEYQRKADYLVYVHTSAAHIFFNVEEIHVLLHGSLLPDEDCSFHRNPKQFVFFAEWSNCIFWKPQA